MILASTDTFRFQHRLDVGGKINKLTLYNYFCPTHNPSPVWGGRKLQSVSVSRNNEERAGTGVETGIP